MEEASRTFQMQSKGPVKPHQANNGEAVGMNKLADHVMLGPRERKSQRLCDFFTSVTIAVVLLKQLSSLKKK